MRVGVAAPIVPCNDDECVCSCSVIYEYAEPVQSLHKHSTSLLKYFGALRSLAEQNKALTLRNAQLEDEVSNGSHKQRLQDSDQAMADVHSENARLQVTFTGPPSICQFTPCIRAM